MIAKCEKCKARYDDTYRWTFCPHDAFAANNGSNEFAAHHDALLLRPVKKDEEQ